MFTESSALRRKEMERRHFLLQVRNSVISFQFTFKNLEKQHLKNANVYNMFKNKYNAIGLCRSWIRKLTVIVVYFMRT